VCKLTRYGLDSTGFEPRWRADVPLQNGHETLSASCTMGSDFLSRGVKQSGRGDDDSPPLAWGPSMGRAITLPLSGSACQATGQLLPLLFLYYITASHHTTKYQHASSSKLIYEFIYLSFFLSFFLRKHFVFILHMIISYP
jgi:hypothetical protein